MPSSPNSVDATVTSAEVGLVTVLNFAYDASSAHRLMIRYLEREVSIADSETSRLYCSSFQVQNVFHLLSLLLIECISETVKKVNERFVNH